MTIRLLIFALLLSVTVACNSGSEKTPDSTGPGRKDMADLNRYFIQKDRERIESYIERKDLKMTETSTGLWYMIQKEGEGALLRDYDRIVLEYKCSLLDGTVCYSSENDGVKEVILGKSELEAGLYQGLKMLRRGGEALFIIPPFLAHGLTGDGNKIPPRSVIVYYVKIREVLKFME